MEPQLRKLKDSPEFFTDEKCFIKELWNSEKDSSVSIARARVEKGVTTKWHHVKNTIERYVIIKGKGVVEIGEQPKQEMNEGDVAIIPAGCRQRITNTGEDDLIFDAICSPRFLQKNYFQIEE